MCIRDRRVAQGIADVDVRQAAERDDIACVGGFNGSAAIGLKAVQRGDAPFFGAVSYTHLDVYKRQSYTFVDAQGGAYRPGCTVRWSSGSLGENGNFYPTLSQAGDCLLYTSRCV